MWTILNHLAIFFIRTVLSKKVNGVIFLKNTDQHNVTDNMYYSLMPNGTYFLLDTNKKLYDSNNQKIKYTLIKKMTDFAYLLITREVYYNNKFNYCRNTVLEQSDKKEEQW